MVTEEETATIVEVKPEEASKEILDSIELYDLLALQFKDEFQFFGKTLEEWSEELSIEIPDHVEPEQLRKKWVELAQKSQTTHKFHSIACGMARTLSSGQELKKSQVVAAIVNNFKAQNAKRPAGHIIETLANNYMKSSMSMNVVATIIKEFWKQQLDSLEITRKILEQISMSLHVEFKWTSNG